jgi:DNA-directed RNA polymerase specialized sigma24 family protein
MQTLRGKDRWELTEDTFACLLRALGPNDELALARYTRLQQRLTFFFMRHRSVSPEDLADEVINRLARALFEGRLISNLEAFALGVARMVVREEHARTLREQHSYQEAHRNKITAEPTSIESDQEIQAREAGYEALPPSARQMLTQYHAGNGAIRINARQQLAQEMGITMGALRKRVFDLQAALRQNVRRSLGHSDPLPNRKEKNHL